MSQCPCPAQWQARWCRRARPAAGGGARSGLQSRRGADAWGERGEERRQQQHRRQPARQHAGGANNPGGRGQRRRPSCLLHPGRMPAATLTCRALVESEARQPRAAQPRQRRSYPPAHTQGRTDGQRDSGAAARYHPPRRHTHSPAERGAHRPWRQGRRQGCASYLHSAEGRVICPPLGAVCCAEPWSSWEAGAPGVSTGVQNAAQIAAVENMGWCGGERWSLSCV